MHLSEMMTRGVQVIRPDATLREAARRMRDCDVGVLPVCDDNRLLGMITDRDVLIRAVAEGRDPDRTRVRDASTERAIYCHEDDDWRDVARSMRELQIRRMPVLDRKNRLVGMISIGDLARHANDERMTGDVLEGISQPQHWSRARDIGGGRAVDHDDVRRSGGQLRRDDEPRRYDQEYARWQRGNDEDRIWGRDRFGDGGREPGFMRERRMGMRQGDYEPSEVWSGPSRRAWDEQYDRRSSA
ncbi:MAG TPA: CBS domain-containing protein [Minicystis sp.]|nr:CBS domain-containing protein [Minicystis sp.]